MNVIFVNFEKENPNHDVTRLKPGIAERLDAPHSK